MSEKPKTEIASDTYKTANAKLSLENGHLAAQIANFTDENKILREQLEQANAIIENDLKADLIIKIQSASDYSEDDLLHMTPTQLQTIEETLSKSKGFASVQQGVYKNIRAGNASNSDSNLTVGSLYGKSREEIMKMGGDF